MTLQTCPECRRRFGSDLGCCPHCMTTVAPQISPGRPSVVEMPKREERTAAERVVELPATDQHEAARLRSRLRRVLNELERDKLIELLLE